MELEQPLRTPLSYLTLQNAARTAKKQARIIKQHHYHCSAMYIRILETQAVQTPRTLDQSRHTHAQRTLIELNFTIIV